MKSPIAATLVLSLAVLVGTMGCTRKSPPAENKAGLEQPRAATKRTISDLAHASLKSVVTVLTADESGQPLEQGSGFVLSADGKVVTNYHVIEGAGSAAIKFADGGIYAVEGVLGADQNVDIAVLKLKASGREFPFLQAGDSSRMNVGDDLVAIGSPKGLEGTVSTGIISGKRGLREMGLPRSVDMEVFQITAPISQGSSGGALLNSAGEVVAVPFVQRVDGQNLNFAIPIKYVLPLVADAELKPFPAIPPRIATPPKRVVPRHEAPTPAPVLAEKPSHTASEVDGTYTGLWQSSVFAASGAAMMTVSTNGKTVRAEIALTGSSTTRETLTGDATEVGGGWSVTFKAASGNLYANGIFKGGVFEGDYDYVPAADHGPWGLKKD